MMRRNREDRAVTYPELNLVFLVEKLFQACYCPHNSDESCTCDAARVIPTANEDQPGSLVKCLKQLIEIH